MRIGARLAISTDILDNGDCLNQIYPGGSFFLENEISALMRKIDQFVLCILSVELRSTTVPSLDGSAN